MPRRSAPKRKGLNVLQIATWLIILLVAISMVLAVLPVGRQ